MMANDPLKQPHYVQIDNMNFILSIYILGDNFNSVFYDLYSPLQ